MGIVLLIVFCFLLHRTAGQQGVRSLNYIVNFVALFFLGMLLFSVGFITWFGVDALQNIQEFEKEIVVFQLLSVVYEVALFWFFRLRIQKAGTYINNDDDYTQPPTPPKKDLSYFR